MADQPLLNTYGRLPIVFDHGRGPWLYDVDGNRYLDTFCGIAVTGLGHAHPAVTRAIQDQAARLVHCSNLFHNTAQRTLAGKLCDISGMDGVFFANSGAEANECALKLARLYGHNRGVHSPAIIVMHRSFHGRTLATLTATGNRRVQAGFEPLVSGFIRAPFNDLDAIAAIARSNPNVVAVLAEPVQGEGGVNVADPAWLQGIREVCDHYGWLMMLDEIQTGNGRTGQHFAYQTYGVTPDVVTLAKGLGNGFPIGACLARGEAARTFQPGHHGSTFGGNPLACTAATAVIETLEQDNLLARARSLSERMRTRLGSAFEGAEYVRDIRGLGLMIGIELASPCAELVPLAKTQGLLLNVTAERVIRLLPPLTLSDQEADMMIDQVIRILRLYAGDDHQPLTPKTP
ncbi:aspartate aminotransferase family protein [Marinobacter halodurans]|uniref:Acetylornithine aminotransferase n=1 Tax=Marinobacter halodurans TaxID=2528979 RepID=A0ABY1ZS47_9GAMM|nr:aspartate aminotransferase family protein [Marinobacter halodurans]TBW57831.1 aspartate aminotransferase family protein [Marinobacter halodurans]